MIKSMTGYGRGQIKDSDKDITIEMKSVNHRYVDFNIRVSRYYNFLEDKVREYLKKYISRGKIDVYITIDLKGEQDKTVLLDEVLAKGYLQALSKLKEDFDLKGDITVSDIARYNDIFKIEKTEEDEEKLWKIVKQVLEISLKDFISMREREGNRLRNDIIQRGKYIATIVDEIEKRSPQIVSEYKEKLKLRIKELLKDVPVDENRVLTEVAIFADKINITEETVRLKSHLAELDKILNSNKPVGRKLDFLIQEVNREINTIASKSNDFTISKYVVEAKAEVEKIREQVQNLE